MRRRSGEHPSRLRQPAAAASASGGVLLDVGLPQHLLRAEAERNWGGHDRHPLGWQPSRFLADHAEAERAFQPVERLGSVNAAAQELGTTWPSLRKAFTRHGLGMPARKPRGRPAAGDRGRPPAQRAASHPPLDPLFASLNPGALPVQE
jgi:hypothetical protein